MRRSGQASRWNFGEVASLIPAEKIEKIRHAVAHNQGPAFALVLAELEDVLELDFDSAGDGKTIFDVLLHVRDGEVAHPLHAAAAHGSVDVIAEAVRMGIGVNEARAVDGTTALAVAARSGGAATCDALINAGAFLDVADQAGLFPIHHAASGGDVDVLELLMAAGASHGVLTGDSVSPLHCAAEAGSVAAVRWLADRGADIDAKTARGYTPLHCAVEGAWPDVVDELFDRGCKVQITAKANNLVELACAAYAEVPRLAGVRRGVASGADDASRVGGGSAAAHSQHALRSTVI